MSLATKMGDPTDLRAAARSIIDSNRYMTLATADRDGVPWASPVWYAPAEYRHFYWVSSPEATALPEPSGASPARDRDLRLPPGGRWNALYMSAAGQELADVDEGIEIFSRRSEAQGLPAWARDDVLPPARHRLYRATASDHYVLDPHDQRIAVDPA